MFIFSPVTSRNSTSHRKNKMLSELAKLCKMLIEAEGICKHPGKSMVKCDHRYIMYTSCMLHVTQMHL